MTHQFTHTERVSDRFLIIDKWVLRKNDYNDYYRLFNIDHLDKQADMYERKEINLCKNELSHFKDLFSIKLVNLRKENCPQLFELCKITKKSVFNSGGSNPITKSYVTKPERDKAL